MLISPANRMKQQLYWQNIHASVNIMKLFMLSFFKFSNIQICKFVLTEGQKVLLCQFKINISTCCSAPTNWIIVKQRRMKSQEILYSKSNKNFCVCIYIYAYTCIHTHTHPHTHTHIYIYIYIYTTYTVHIYILYIYIYTHIHTNMYIYIHTCIHTYSSYIYTYIHTHIICI